MANEISIASSIRVKNGNHSGGPWKGSFKADQSGLGGGAPGKVALTTSEEQIDFGELTSAGWVWIKNIGDTNAAQIGFASSFTSGIQIDAGQTAGPFKLIASSSVYAKSAASTTTLQFIALEA